MSQGRLVSVVAKSVLRRKYHKTICTKTSTGEAAPSRPPAIKLVEKMMTDDDLMCHINGILIKALDLEHHPGNAEKYAVALSCHVESTDTNLAASRLVYYMNGKEPPPLPDKIPKLLQISKHALLSGDSIPPALNDVAERQRVLLREHGHLKPGVKEYLIRDMWVSPESEWATCYWPRLVNQEMINQVASWMVPKDHKEGFTDKPMSTERLIKSVCKSSVQGLVLTILSTLCSY
ncbi:hypothetical protein C8Q74DRAFT_1214922 [Fomes fomentarius]|nr:hypothetical protein C8Q74DRAFT_1214922 [Fomes fomentarius]